MASRIHPTAIIEDGAQIAEDVEIGAFAYIGSRVTLGPGSVVHHHASIEGWTTFGKANEIFPYAFIGGHTQDKKWNGEVAHTEIGDRNTFREFTSLHPSTFAARQTLIGSDNLFCAYAHIGHESKVGNHCIFSNNATLGGHVICGDRVVIGGLSAIHQFCHIGDGAMIGGCCKVLQDVLPFMLAEGYPATHRTINKVGMQRSGFEPGDIRDASQIFKTLFKSGLNRTQALEAIRSSSLGTSAVGKVILAFIETSTRGLA